MKIVIIVVASLLVLLVAGAIFFMSAMPKQEDFVHLVEPRIIDKPDVLSIKVDFEGDPNVVIAEAYKSLYAVYYGLKGVKKGSEQKAPIARYQGFEEILEKVQQEDLKSVDWKGFVAVPVPQEVVFEETGQKNSAYPVRLETLKYGVVAEIVHFGPYATEDATIGKLLTFIEEQGYKIAGDHEEEYILGPGMPFSKPEKYITIIRYQVEKI